MVGAACVFGAAVAHAGSTERTLEARLSALASHSPVPGFCVAVVDASGPRYSAGFGYADIATRGPYTSGTVQEVASISKTLIGVAVMQAVEEGLLTLDEDLRPLLPFEVSNPRFPDAPITLAELATHTSGIIDREPFYDRSYYSGPQTAFALKDFLASYLDRHGRFHSANNFGVSRPGARFDYSNIGATLAAYAIEAKRGVRYADTVHERILGPLGMRASGWTPADAKAEAATLYDEDRKVITPYSYPDYPDGGLYSSCDDLGKFLSAMIAGYGGKNGVLTAASFRAMLSPRFAPTHPPRGVEADTPNEGVFWQFSAHGEIGHAGGDPGVSTFMFFDPKSGVGRILIANVGNDGVRPAVGEALQAVWTALGAYARSSGPNAKLQHAAH